MNRKEDQKATQQFNLPCSVHFSPTFLPLQNQDAEFNISLQTGPKWQFPHPALVSHSTVNGSPGMTSSKTWKKLL